MTEMLLTAREKAVAFLKDYFSARPEGAWLQDVRAAAEAEGVGYDTLRRAAKQLQVESRSSGRQGSIWRLPEGERREP